MAGLKPSVIPPLVGKIRGWSADPITWPGVFASDQVGPPGASTDGITTSNYYAYTDNVVPVPATSRGTYSGCRGGGRKKKLRKTRAQRKGRARGARRTRQYKMKGGFSPSDLIGNVWYELQNAVTGLYADFAGVEGPPSSSPLVQPDIQNPPRPQDAARPPPDLHAAQRQAQAQVAQSAAAAHSRCPGPLKSA